MNSLKSGQDLNVGDSIRSNNGEYTLTLQTDGNLTLLGAGQVIWDTGTSNQQVVRAVLEQNGSLVLYRSDGVAAWTSSSSLSGGPGTLVLQDDRNVVIYPESDQPEVASAKTREERGYWASETAVDPSEPVDAHVDEEVGRKKWMVTDARLYRNGFLVARIDSTSGHPTEALRPHVLIAVVDNAGRAIWVSPEFVGTTRCARYDVSCASRGVDTKTASFPEIVGKLARRLDIYQSEEGLGGYRENIIRGIKNLRDIGQELKDAIDSLS
ncbi:hypothetical protein [Streptomyces sp. NPDC053542]|uniref:hypothetical protein n=1 Tax=Streptomyces sp. NPDC053542 TaxID=3365710 RepID=UPI0037D24806